MIEPELTKFPLMLSTLSSRTPSVSPWIRPEFLTLTSGEGLPFSLRRVEDVGRHRIVRGEVAGTPVNIIADEGAEIGVGMTHVRMQADKINVYADDWRVEGAV